MKSKIAIALLLLTSLSACSTKWSTPVDECVFGKIVVGPRLVIGSTKHNEWRWEILRRFDHAAANPFDPAGIAQDRAEIEAYLSDPQSILAPDLARQIANHNQLRGQICGTGSANERPD
jgi:hypothetical protein